MNPTFFLGTNFETFKVFMMVTWMESPDSILPQTRLNEHYVVTKRLAKTDNSVVYLGLQDNVLPVAIKCMTPAQFNEDEILLLKELEHPLVIQLLDDFCVGQIRCLVFPYARNGTAQSLLRSCRGLGMNKKVARTIIRQMASALAFIHAKGIIHNDIKLENVLLFGDDPKHPRIALADFGSAVRAIITADPRTTLEYASPEKVRRLAVTNKTDIWSFGVAAYALLAGRRPFDTSRPGNHQREATITRRITAAAYTFDTKSWAGREGAQPLIQKMLIVDPECRFSADAILADEWLLEPDCAE
jgi:serine/threonine protein kinase